MGKIQKYLQKTIEKQEILNNEEEASSMLLLEHVDKNEEAILDRLGLNKELNKARLIKSKSDAIRHFKTSFNSVLSLSEIEKLCHKYNLDIFNIHKYYGGVNIIISKRFIAF